MVCRHKPLLFFEKNKENFDQEKSKVQEKNRPINKKGRNQDLDHDIDQEKSFNILLLNSAFV